jgi:hypothetical protein
MRRPNAQNLERKCLRFVWFNYQLSTYMKTNKRKMYISYLFLNVIYIP